MINIPFLFLEERRGVFIDYRKKRNNGFSLMELSIVLLIVGVFIITTLGSSSLITAAKINNCIVQVWEYKSAFNTFYEIYGRIPGAKVYQNPDRPDDSESKNMLALMHVAHVFPINTKFVTDSSSPVEEMILSNFNPKIATWRIKFLDKKYEGKEVTHYKGKDIYNFLDYSMLFSHNLLRPNGGVFSGREVNALATKLDDGYSCSCITAVVQNNEFLDNRLEKESYLRQQKNKQSYNIAVRMDY
jgi:prepilin-type N-terminal cleavage/methylation domain-containing protein